MHTNKYGAMAVAHRNDHVFLFCIFFCFVFCLYRLAFSFYCKKPVIVSNRQHFAKTKGKAKEWSKHRPYYNCVYDVCVCVCLLCTLRGMNMVDCKIMKSIIFKCMLTLILRRQNWRNVGMLSLHCKSAATVNMHKHTHFRHSHNFQYFLVDHQQQQTTTQTMIDMDVLKLRDLFCY